MSNIDLLIYAAHLAFWVAFGLTRIATGGPDAASAEETENVPAAGEGEAAPFSRAAVALHSVAFGVMYFALGAAVIPHRVPTWFPGQSVVGVSVIAVGAVLASWAVASFRSWRFRAKVDQRHQLATGGPFRLFRHPIYMGLNLLALGSAIWVPTSIMWSAFILILAGSDLRARIEERLLMRVFGATYKEYCARTQRFIPGIY